MKRLGLMVGALAALPTAALAQTEAGAVAARSVAIELREGDQLVGAPTFALQLGRPAAISLGGYSLRVRVVRAPAAADGHAPYVVRSSLYRSESGWALVASPVLTVAEGEQARLDFTGSDGSGLSLAVAIR